MRILIVEEALKGLKGHWFQYIRDLVEGGAVEGHEIEVVVHREACNEILENLPARPILRSTVFEPSGGPGGKIRGLWRTLKHNRSLYRDLSSLLGSGDEYDWIIATTARLDHLLAYRRLLSRGPGRGFRRMGLMLIDAVGELTADGSQVRHSRSFLPLKWALRSFRRHLEQGGVRFLAESPGMARQFRLFSGMDFDLVPHVVTVPDLEVHRKSGKEPTLNRRLVFGSYGITRYDKGLDVLQDAIKVVRRRQQGSETRFVLQWVRDYQLPDGSWARRDPDLLADPNVQYVPACSLSVEYYQLLAQTDVVVLPYRRGFYADRLSRVAIDAAIAGLPIIYPRGTWLESFAAGQAAGIRFEPENPDSLAEAIFELTGKFDEIKRAAIAVRERTREAFSARAFFEALRELGNRNGTTTTAAVRNEVCKQPLML